LRSRAVLIYGGSMGIRGELFSTKVSLQNRTYFFNVKENRLGDLYLNIVESKNRDEGGFERQSVILFAEDLQEFLQGFDESLRVLEKAVREKRRGKGASFGPRDDDRDNAGNYPRQDYRKDDAQGRSEGIPEGVRKERDFPPRRNFSPRRDHPSGDRGRPRSKGFGVGRPEGPGRARTRKDFKDTRYGGRRYDDSDTRPPRDSAPGKKRFVVKKR
jgi:hypothetical protein